MTEDNAGSVSGKAQNAPKANAHLDRLFDFIVTEIKEQGAAPSYEQICSSLGYSKGLVSRRIRQLHDQGRIIIDGERKSMFQASCTRRGAVFLYTRNFRFRGN